METIELIERIRTGERNLTLELWERLRPLTFKFIGSYLAIDSHERLYEEADLLQDCYLAMCQAIDYWEPDKGAFSSVYLWAIRSETRTTRGYYNGRNADPLTGCTSLDAPISAGNADDHSETTRGDLIPDETAGQGYEEIERASYNESLHRALQAIATRDMTPQQQEAIELIYWQGLPLNVAATVAGVPLETLQKRKISALQVYRRPPNKRQLRGFVFWASPRSASFYSAGLNAYIHRQGSSVEIAAEQDTGTTPQE